MEIELTFTFVLLTLRLGTKKTPKASAGATQ